MLRRSPLGDGRESITDGACRVEYRDLDSKVAGVSRGGKIVDEVVVRIGV